MEREFLYLLPGKQNPEAMVKGRATERAKAERPTEAFSRYYEMLRDRKKILAEEKPPEEKKPRIKYAEFPVKNPQSPVVQQREP